MLVAGLASVWVTLILIQHFRPSLQLLERLWCVPWCFVVDIGECHMLWIEPSCCPMRTFLIILRGTASFVTGINVAPLYDRLMMVFYSVIGRSHIGNCVHNDELHVHAISLRNELKTIRGNRSTNHSCPSYDASRRNRLYPVTLLRSYVFPWGSVPVSLNLWSSRAPCTASNGFFSIPPSTVHKIT